MGAGAGPVIAKRRSVDVAESVRPPIQIAIYDHIRIWSYMVKPVSLSDPAFAALRKEKRTGESDSDVVLRVIAEARAKRKDPLGFLRYRPKRTIPLDDYVEMVRRTKEAEREKALRWTRGGG